MKLVVNLIQMVMVSSIVRIIVLKIPQKHQVTVLQLMDVLNKVTQIARQIIEITVPVHLKALK
jgi:hypothetical protein